MKIAKQIVLIITLCISQLFIQCSADDNRTIEEKVLTEQEANEINVLTNFLSETLGIPAKKIIYNLDRKAFIIDKDVIMPLKEAREHYNKSKLKITGKTNQQVSHMLINPEMAKSIKIYIYPEVSSE